MYIAKTTIRVRYSETDQMGYVYYGNYASYYEVGRVEALRQLGLTYKQLEDSGVMMPVLECKSNYIKPAVYDQLLTIIVKIPVIPSVRIKFIYEIFAEDETLLHTGETTLVFVNMKTGRPIRMPEQMRSLLSPYFNEK